mgnify:CR=1 FL=1
MPLGFDSDLGKWRRRAGGGRFTSFPRHGYLERSVRAQTAVLGKDAEQGVGSLTALQIGVRHFGERRGSPTR